MIETLLSSALQFIDGHGFLFLLCAILCIARYNVEIRSKVHDLIHRDSTPYTAHLEYKTTTQHQLNPTQPASATTGRERPMLVAPPRPHTRPSKQHVEVPCQHDALLEALDDIEDHFSMLTLAERHNGMLGLSFDHVDALQRTICGYNSAVFDLASSTGDDPLESCALMVDFERLEQPYTDQIRHYLQTIEERIQNARQHLSDCQAS